MGGDEVIPSDSEAKFIGTWVLEDISLTRFYPVGQSKTQWYPAENEDTFNQICAKYWQKTQLVFTSDVNDNLVTVFLGYLSVENKKMNFGWKELSSPGFPSFFTDKGSVPTVLRIDSVDGSGTKSVVPSISINSNGKLCANISSTDATTIYVFKKQK